MGSGKSTLVAELRKKLPTYAYVDRPNIKRGLKPIGNELARKIARTASFAAVGELIDFNVDMLLEELSPESLMRRFRDKIRENKYTLHSFYLNIGLETSLKRDLERSGKDHSVNVIDVYQRAKHTSYDTVLDTERLSKEECLKAILSSLNP
jgi:predicted ABC-type ATPase